MKVCHLIIVTVLAVSTTPSHSLELLPNRGHYSVPVKSYSEIVFGNVLRQKYDFSCGSAALASLLSFHYKTPSKEEDVFKVMFDNGDKKLIEQKGFSLLDMKLYLESVGFKSDGFNLPLDKIRKVGVPGITLVNFDGYLHFVVIKGMNNEFVIVGDPSRGTIKIKYSDFEQHYMGIVLLIRNKAEVGKETFITDDNFNIYTSSPTDIAVRREGFGTLSIPRPGTGQY